MLAPAAAPPGRPRVFPQAEKTNPGGSTTEQPLCGCGCHAFTICHGGSVSHLCNTSSVRERETTRQGKMQNTLHSSGDRRLQWKVLLHANVQSGVGGTWRKAHVPPPDPPAVHRCTAALAVIVAPSAAPSPEASRVGRWSAKAHTGNPDLLGAVKAGRTLVGRKLHEGVGQEELVSQ